MAELWTKGNDTLLTERDQSGSVLSASPQFLNKTIAKIVIEAIKWKLALTPAAWRDLHHIDGDSAL
ncbi:MAG: hypothetical protein PGN19_10060 [Pseudomonas oryzihabitans]